jgi:Rad3-related DNA helicase
VFASPKTKDKALDAPNKSKTAQPKLPNLTGIPDVTKQRFENLSGFSFDDVRVHYNSSKPAQLQALAYTQGNQVYVAPGQEKHLSHELGHVVQQKQGNVQPTMQLHGANVNDEDKLEAEANEIGEKATIQRIKVDDLEIANDLKHEQATRLFNDITIKWKNRLSDAQRAELSREVGANRGMISYKRLRSTPLRDRSGLFFWLQQRGEHMYVHAAEGILVANREGEKLPHPTLIGGDPDVKGAGTMLEISYGEESKIGITNKSGHFRPRDIHADTVKTVRSILGTGGTVVKRKI